jgi:halocyanin-like protein
MAAVGASTPAGAQEDAYDGFLSEEGTWGGTTTDASDEDEIIVDVGAAGNTGNFAFAPTAIYIEPGQTITWEWTGEGGAHNVYHDNEDDQLFNSQEEHDGTAIDEARFTYEFTFEEGDEGVYPYVCTPHRSLEMKGVVVVGEDNVETDLVPYGEGGGGDEGGPSVSVMGGAAVFGAVTLLGVAVYSELIGDGEEY